jgi:hypothetical protein
MAAAAGADNKIIIYFIGCKNIEAVADIKFAIDGIASYTDQHQIAISKGTAKGNKCGYLLIMNDKNKTLNSAWIDVDLLQNTKDFLSDTSGQSIDLFMGSRRHGSH